MTSFATLRSERAAPTAEPAGSRRSRAGFEGLGTSFLLAIVVGSGVMGERLAGGNAALALLVNSLATGAGLIGILLTFGPLSGAHLNPIVTLTEAWSGRFPWRDVPAYVVSQIAGALAGVAAAHLMFGEPFYSIATTARPGLGRVLAEFVATFGLVLVVRGSARRGTLALAVAVGCYVAAAFWFTSSTAFANPAVTIARAVSDTFVGIRPVDVPGFLIGQLAGGVTAAVVVERRLP
jgi:glycerol uptake facilitator-like aquaporin